MEALWLAGAKQRERGKDGEQRKKGWVHREDEAPACPESWLPPFSLAPAGVAVFRSVSVEQKSCKNPTAENRGYKCQTMGPQTAAGVPGVGTPSFSKLPELFR